MSVLAIIQSRLGSQRFPYKALADICGRPMIAHVVDRVRQVRGVDTVVLAVPPKDAYTYRMLNLGVPVLAPDVEPHRVLDRFAAVVAMYQEHDILMRVTGDTPMLQPRLGERLLDLYASSGCDYAWINTHNGGWPDGLDIEVFSRRCLLEAFWNADNPSHREHVTGYVREKFRVVELPADGAHAAWPKCSVDYPEDLKVVERLIAEGW